jgi:myo-inositol-1(or 4)-monophosphatase
MKDIIRTACKAAVDAGNHLLKSYDKEISIQTKADNSSVTNLDKESEEIIINCIRSRYPHHDIISEENNNYKIGSEYTWVIDPLDGTHNFINKIPLFTVSIGIYNIDKVVAGIIYVPFTRDLYIGQRGHGAFKNKSRLSVSSKSDISDCAFHFDSGLKKFTRNEYDIISSIAYKSFNNRVLGCSTLNLALCAEGAIDIVVEFDDYPWDYCSGIVILNEAGGKVTDINGDNFVFGNRAYIASNGYVHKKIIDLIERYTREYEAIPSFFK